MRIKILPVFLLAALLLLTALPFHAVSAESSFTGKVTCRRGKNVYLQNGTQGILAFLDSTNDPALLDAVQVGKVITVVGERSTLKQAGYHIPELIDAMIVAVSDSGASVTVVDVSLGELGGRAHGGQGPGPGHQGGIRCGRSAAFPGPV